MHRLTPFLALLLWAMPSAAQGFDTHWIRMPQPDSTSHVWFRQTYLPAGRARDASITVVTTGFFKLYVNECNVGRVLYYPARATGDDAPVAMTFNVTPYLRSDTDVVAIAYSPAWPHLNSRQISVAFHGRAADGTPFCHWSDGNWLCRKANSCLTTDGRERVDGRRHNAAWRTAWFDPALWVSAETQADRPDEQPESNLPADRHRPTDGVAPHIVRRRGCSYIETVGKGVELEFGQGFHGRLRLTLRNALPGERICMDGLEYICSGEMDEQACPVFLTHNYRRPRLTGDSRFRRDQVTEAEALETSCASDSQRNMLPLH